MPVSTLSCLRPAHRTRRVPLSRRTLRAIGFWLLSAVVWTLGHAAEAIRVSFDLPADVMDKSLKRFSTQSGIDVLFPPDAVAGVKTQPVRGEMAPRQALDAMLQLTGFVAISDPKSGALTVARENHAEPDRPDGGGSGPGRRDGVKKNSTEAPPSPMSKPTLLARLAAAAALIASSPGQAQPAGTGTLTGHVFNPATSEYVRNAEVRVEGTNLAVYTEAAGSYRIAGVPSGDARIIVTYTGTTPVRTVVRVAPGETTVRDFELGSSMMAGDLVKLTEFTVSAEREGSAKAIMDQRAAINVKNVIASDSFGDITMGNIGEFVKYVPGIVLDYVEPDARGARIGGLDPKYSAVTMDGNRIASGASASFGAGTRAFEFEQASLNSVEAVEINKTLIPSLDADSPAGAINMRLKNAFDRKRRHLEAVFSTTMNGNYGRTLARIQGPGNTRQRMIFPGGLLDYSDIFLKGRLGLQMTLSDQREFTQATRSQTTYNYATPGRVPLVNELVFRPGEKISHRAAANFNLDFKASPNLIFSVRSAFSHFDGNFHNRRFRLTANVAQITPDSTLSHVTALATANANTRYETQYSHRDKRNDTATMSPKIEYKSGPLAATLGGSYSRSTSHYEDMNSGFFQRSDVRLTRMSWMAVRGSDRESAWSVYQLSGPDWNDPASYMIGDAFPNNVSSTAQRGKNQQFTGYMDLTRSFATTLPVTLKTGWKTRLVSHAIRQGDQQWTYVGPTGNQLTSPVPRDPVFDYRVYRGGNIDDINWYVPDQIQTYEQYRAHPEYFVEDAVGNLTRRLQGGRGITEQVDAGYLESSTRWHGIRFLGGARYERTRTIGRTIDVLPDAKVTAAGYKAGTLDFVQYKYRNGVKTPRYGEYGNWFFSGNAKYSVTRDLELQAGFSQSIYRPDYNNLAGIATINETDRTVTVPNPALRPELSNKALVGVQYYFEPAGMIGISTYQLWVKDRVGGFAGVNVGVVGGVGSAGSAGSASDALAGYANDPNYAGYEFRVPLNSPGVSTTQGVDIEYRQQLTFLPGPLKGFSVFANLSRVHADSRQIGLVPKAVSGGIGYRYRRFNIQLRSTWTAARILLINEDTNPRYEWAAERTMIDTSAAYQFTDKLSFTVSGRNILNSPGIQYSNEPGRMLTNENYGALWTFGVKVRF